MGIFTNFLLDGFTRSEEKFYSPGTLYEVMSKLGEELRGDQMRSKVKTLLDGWYARPQSFRDQGQQVPVYALEIHAVNEKNNPRNGYGTYVFVPDERQKMVVVPIKSTFSEPSELYDDEDPVKILSALYSDADGYSKNESLSIYELTCKNDEFYPLNMWTKEFANDPLEEMFGVFDSLGPNEFAGISIVVVPPEDEWDLNGKKRIHYIEDPSFEEDIGMFETLKRIWRKEDLPDDEVRRLMGIQGKDDSMTPREKALWKQARVNMSKTKLQLDPREKAEIEAISGKVNGNAFRCTLRVYASSNTVADELSGIIMQKTSGRYNSLVIFDKNVRVVDLAMRREGQKPFLMSDDEIASIWHVPAENTMGEKRHHPLPAALQPPDELLAINVGEPGDIQKLLLQIR